MSRAALLGKAGTRALLVCGLVAFQLFFLTSPLVCVSAAGEPPPAPGEAPTPPSVPTPKEAGKTRPPAPSALPEAPGLEEALGLEAPGPTAPPPAPGLVDRFQRRIGLLPPGRLLFNLTVEEEYDDNVFQDSKDRKGDFRTLIVPAVAFDRTRGKTSLTLRYTPTIFQYVRFPELNRVDHTLVAAASWGASPRVHVSLQENLLITEDVVEASPLGISTEQGRTIQNVVSPALNFTLTSRSDLTFNYTNTITLGEDDNDDSTVHDGSIAWSHRLLRGAVNLAYSLAFDEREVSSNLVRHQGSLSTSWRLTPRNALLLSGSASFQDEEEEADSNILTGSVGVTHDFSRRLSTTGNVGITQFDQEGRDAEIRLFADSNLAWTFPRGSLTLTAEQRFEETFSTVDDVGTVLESRVSAALSYQAGHRLALSVSGSYSRVDLQAEDRIDLIGSLGIDIQYRLRRLTLTAGYNFFDRDSDQEGNDLLSNRIFIGLSLGFSTRLPF